MIIEFCILAALIVLCLICWRVSVQLGKIETILFVQIKNLEKLAKGE
jgi:hypothetical protein